MQWTAVLLALGAGIRLRRQHAVAHTNPQLGSGDAAATDALTSGGTVAANATGPPDLPAFLEVASPDKMFITMALDNWNQTKNDLAVAFAALLGANATRFEITSEMDQDEETAPNMTAVMFGLRSPPGGEFRVPAAAAYVAETPEQAEERLLAAQQRVQRDVPPPLLYFFNVSISTDPIALCPHADGGGTLNPDPNDPTRCDCKTVIRADTIAAAILQAMQQGKLAGYDLDGRVAGIWAGQKRFMKPTGPPRPTGILKHWEGGAPVTPKEALGLSTAVNNQVSDFVAEQMMHMDAAAKAMQMAGHIPCAGSLALGAVPDPGKTTYSSYPCIEQNAAAPEVPTNGLGPAAFGPVAPTGLGAAAP